MMFFSIMVMSIYFVWKPFGTGGYTKFITVCLGSGMRRQVNVNGLRFGRPWVVSQAVEDPSRVARSRVDHQLHCIIVVMYSVLIGRAANVV